MNIFTTGIYPTADAQLDALLAPRSPAKDGGFEALLGLDQPEESGKSGASLLDFAGLSSESFSALLQIHDSGLYPPTLTNRAALETLIGSDGPLPTYLQHVVTSRNLNAEQTQALYDITARHMDIVKTPEAIEGLRQELQAAGIA